MDVKSIALGLAFVVMWSSAFTAARIAVMDAPPFLTLTGRFLVAGLCAIAFAYAKGQRISFSRRQWVAIFIFGLCQNALYLGLFFEAMTTIEASLATIIASALPLLVALLSMIFLKERLKPVAIAGLMAGFAGVLIVMSSRVDQGGDLRGILLGFVGVLALAVATLVIRNAGAKGNLLMIVGLQMLVGAVVLFPVTYFLEDWVVNVTPSLVIAFLYMIFIPGLLATVIWFELVDRIGATYAATFHFLNPFVGVLIAAVLLGEAVGISDVIGIAIIMAGIFAVQVSRSSRR